MAADLYIGLMSGTSADAIDAALVRFDPAPTMVAGRTFPIPQALRSEIRDVSAQLPLSALGPLDVRLGRAFADAVTRLLRETGTPACDVRAIGSHGQTIWHAPTGDTPFTMQIGDPNVIAEETGITTVADFRRRDVAAGGQGAPLVPAFHREIFGTEAGTHCVLNLGGIANISVLGPSGVIGFDTGPANTLMDDWVKLHRNQPYDKDGAWAAEGRCRQQLLDALLQDSYFRAAPPKSTGPEYFSREWLQRHLAGCGPMPPEDVQATLLELTARSVADAVRQHAADADRLLVCGGGAHNRSLMVRLGVLLAPLRVASTASVGIDPDFVEACAFAWLARQRLLGAPGNVPAVTGARAPVVLGAIYAGRS